ncbi:ABC transporter substrate-binding protein [Nocardioides sp. GY 10127]|uniref:ABC transporter substrate-binding protein n=1 Tax=Nocardioides sp. GY 10127 TaxID=2569762 RepID=UPI0010A8C8E6|nr:ABC transporter substrate-binding protein [Nocardioides sp. GY 10127]TIC79116.1 ABC transporter substrate-binding protein [Nocardioides sp. GY 10127]
MNPRAALRSAGALSVTGLMLLLAACSGSSSSDEGTDASALTQANTFGTVSSSLDVLKWNFPAEPNTLDPTTTGGYAGTTIVASTCDSLTYQTADFEIKPHLATPTQVSPTKVTLDINTDATFWDGKPVTPADVIYSLEKSASPTAYYNFAFTYVKDMKQTGAHQVTVTFTQPDELFVKELSSNVGTVWEKAYAEKAGDKYGTAEGGIMCSGPLELSDWTPGQSITLTKNPDYWDPTFEAQSDEIDISFVADSSAVTQGLLSGDLDGASNLAASTIDSLSDTDAGTLVSGQTITQTYLALTNPGGRTGSTDLRKAIFGSLDRDTIASSIYQGAAEGAYTAIPSDYWESDATDIYEPAYESYEADRNLSTEDAKALVEKSGYDGETLTLAYAAGDATVQLMAQYLQQQMATIGVDLKLKSLQTAAYSNVLYSSEARKDIDFVIFDNYGYTLDPVESLAFFFGTGQVFNFTDWDDAAVQKGIAKLRTTFDTTKRVTEFVKLQDAWETELPLTTIVVPRALTFVGDGIGGVTTSAAANLQPSLALIGAE